MNPRHMCRRTSLSPQARAMRHVVVLVKRHGIKPQEAWRQAIAYFSPKFKGDLAQALTADQGPAEPP